MLGGGAVLPSSSRGRPTSLVADEGVLSLGVGKATSDISAAVHETEEAHARTHLARLRLAG